MTSCSVEESQAIPPSAVQSSGIYFRTILGLQPPTANL